jgi:DNA polymerase III subunit epsilon
MASHSPWRGQSGISDDGEVITLQRFRGAPPSPAYFTPEWARDHASEIALAMVLDVETSGLSPTDDAVIEIGLSVFQYHRVTGEYLAVSQTYSGLQDPGAPLSQEIIELTGLTDADLKGQRIDWLAVERLLALSEVIIAHNATFDRAFIEKYVPMAAGKLWSCSLRQIDWQVKGFGVQKLDILSIFHGFFTDAHRALNDANALLNLLRMKDTVSETPYLKELLANAHRPFVKVTALYSPFETKDLLKQRRYRWDPAQKAWYKHLYKDAFQAEVEWLESSIYQGAFRGRCEEIPVTENFRGTY